MSTSVDKPMELSDALPPITEEDREFLHYNPNAAPSAELVEMLRKVTDELEAAIRRSLPPKHEHLAAQHATVVESRAAIAKATGSAL